MMFTGVADRVKGKQYHFKISKDFYRQYTIGFGGPQLGNHLEDFVKL